MEVAIGRTISFHEQIIDMSSQNQTTKSGRARRNEQALLAPILFLIGFAIGYLLLVHYMTVSVPDAFVAVVSAVVIMTVGLAVHDRIR